MPFADPNNRGENRPGRVDSGAREAQPTPEDWGQSNVLEVEEDQKRKLPAASTKRKGNE